MARIRSLKPEAFQSETLGSVSVEAERTFFGLTTQVDDRGRIRDSAAVINGLLWSLRPHHTPVELEAELGELERAELVCRYVGCDGRRYLHLTTWDDHQKIDRPSKSRLPCCPEHGDGDYCGRHQGDCSSRVAREDSPNAREDARASDAGSRTLDRGSRTVDQRARAAAREPTPPAAPPAQPPRPDGLTSSSQPAPGNVGGAAAAEPMSRTSGYPRQGQPPRAEASGGSARRDGLSALPDDFTINDAMRRWAIATHGVGLDLDFETEQFISYFRSTGDRRRSWPDAWQKWIRDSAKRASERSLRTTALSPNGAIVPVDRRQQATDAMFGRALQRARTRDAEEAAGEP